MIYQSFLALSQVFAALVTAIATVVLARLTYTLTKETRRANDLSSQPFVILAFEETAAGAPALSRTVRNVGAAAAFDIRVSMDPSLSSQDLERTQDDIFTISVLPPGQSVTTGGIVGIDTVGMETKVTTEWKRHPDDRDSERLEYSIKIDKNIYGWEVKTTHHLTKEVEKIRKLMETSR